MKHIGAALCIIIILMGACTPRLRQWQCTATDIQQAPSSYEKTSHKSRCYDPLAYIPDTLHPDHTPMKYLRVNFHWLDNTARTQNFSEERAIAYTKGLIHAANYDLAKNEKMWLPIGNATPKLPIRYRYVLSPRPGDPNDDGIHFHYDDELFAYVHKGKNANLHQREVIKKYGVQLDTVLNIFVMPHHPDSVGSPTYSANRVGVALGNAVKLAGPVESGKDYWIFRGVFNHEIGHIFGLSHTWAYDDGCEDTPKHPQSCYGREDRPGCDTLTSNNVMDYNALQNSWSPCQIGKIHAKMATEAFKPRNYLVPEWCTLHEDRTIVISDTIVWDDMKDLEGNLVIQTGGMLTVRCRLSMPKAATITVEPGATLMLDECRLHNACGDKWGGIIIQQKGKLKGQVQMTGKVKIEDWEGMTTFM